MKEKLYADTNLFLRFLTNEPSEQIKKVKKLLEDTVKGEYELFICDLVIAEIVYVLESVYKLNKKDIAEKILALAELKNIIVENKTIIIAALETYKYNNLDFTDSYIACHAKRNEHVKICTFDEDFKKLNFIEIYKL
ncbi:MAG: type II toxin-antitoxin system VapC family toxin [Actinobacteria bacterium]|nr:type II toxin-antitoxin system VapC family toxin [Actinomycetota bacterium]